MRRKAATALAVAVGAFILYTSAFGPYESLVQRAIFLALVVCLGLLVYPLGEGRRWRPAGIAVDLALAAVTVFACGYIVVNYADIMSALPWATPLDMALTAGLVLTILELSRRAIGWVFPGLVTLGLAYALFGDAIPGRLGHRGFDQAFVTETLFLGDLGIWGMLLGVAATTIAAFVLFGSLLLHTGGGQAFIDLAMRVGGRSPGGAAKIATIASGLFGMVSGSAVANVATTGNFTIPMMKRLGYPPAFAAAVEAVASTGGQIAPPILGAAAFVMAEILGTSYLTIAVAALLPAIFFYAAVFATVHVVAVQRGLRIVPDEELPSWPSILAPRRMLPIAAALGGLFFGILTGRSIQTAAFFGIVGLLAGFVATRAGVDRPRDIAARIVEGLGDAGRGLVIIGVLLAGAQILVSMINMTGIGVTLSSLIVAVAGNSLFLVALIVAGVCLVMGMGIPTTAAYVLVAAVLAPALVAAGVEPLVAHMFVFYFATISVITPPVCVAVFVASGIAQTNWMPVAVEAVRLAAVTYMIPFMFFLYPGMLGFGGAMQIAEAAVSGLILVVATSCLLGGMRIFARRVLDTAFFVAVGALAILPWWIGPILAGVMLVLAFGMGRRPVPLAAGRG
ncbi:TRAP transporter fused permease subunit (plasmid) [Skermanella mucosa]|uniref:TRAP transporter permease n=1 Tax=Skermanella mucosa TaxID=1789672 RepID=UPI00192B7EB8|nr:TRAP transporter fused permease subunit [Skermanella mucosa]UEM24720.1 TRAP transporter fused permease subunit [Skermanella mucosa]